jgi:hypothetical protein
MGEPARHRAEDEPEPPDLAELRRRFAALTARAEAELAQSPGDRHLTALTICLRAAVTQLSRATFDSLRVAGSLRQARIDGYDEGYAAASRQRVPRARHAATRNPLLNVVRVLVPVAGGAALVLRRSLGRHPAVAAAKASLTAHKIAAATTSLVAAGGTAAVLTVSGLGPNVTLPWTAASPQASVPGWHTSAVPFPSSSPVADLTKPKARHDSDGKHLLAAAGVPAPSWTSAPYPAPSSSSPPSSAPASTAPAGPAVLTVGATSLDLSAVPQAVVTLTATGAGWVSWSVTTTGTDLDFSKKSGVLAAGQSYQLTVSLDPSQDGLTAQTFEIAGAQVTVTLPLPVPVPTVSPDPVVSDLPSLLPSPGSS